MDTSNRWECSQRNYLGGESGRKNEVGLREEKLKNGMVEEVVKCGCGSLLIWPLRV